MEKGGTGIAHQSRSTDRRGRKRPLGLPLPVVLALALLAMAFLVGAWRATDALRARAASAYAPTPAEEDTARQLCDKRLERYTSTRSPSTGEENHLHARLLASYPAQAKDVASEEERRRERGFRSPFRDLPAEEVVALCFFEADALGVPPHIDPRRLPPGVWKRMEVVLRSDGTPYVLRGGSASEVKPAPVPQAQG